MLRHGAQHGILLLLVLEHAQHLLLGRSQFAPQLLVLPLDLEHTLSYLLRRVPYHLVHVNNSLDVFGFGPEIQGLL